MEQNTQDLEHFFNGVIQKHFQKENSLTNSLKINPEVHRLVLWINCKPDKEITYTLRIGNQRFLSLANVDKKGQTYWRFKAMGEYSDGLELINPKNNQENVSKENH